MLDDSDQGTEVTPADKVLNIERFLESVDGGRVFTLVLLHNAARQLQNAKEGNDVELIDCYGKSVTFTTQDGLAAGYLALDHMAIQGKCR